GPEALRTLAKWSADPRGPVQRTLAQVWRYFDPTDYAEAVLRDAPLDNGRIEINLVEHVPHLRRLQHLRGAQLELHRDVEIDDLGFLYDVPPVITLLTVLASSSVDISSLADLPDLVVVYVLGGEVSAGWEVLPGLAKLWSLAVNLPDSGPGLSFVSILTECLSLRQVILNGCTALSDLGALVSASHLKNVYLRNAKHIRDLRALNALPNLERLGIDDAPLTGGLAAIIPVLDRLVELDVWRVPTCTSLDAVAGGSLQEINLADCPITDLAPLSTMQSLTRVWLRQFSALDLAPLVMLPNLRDLHLLDMEEPIDLSPLAQVDHRLRVHLRDTATTGNPGPLVKIRKF
ncbi:MAG: hypothetical protein LC775_16950, partial [Acidobacteria bacterium]|nr:hypothetical protein [Acidobacteriota bacterium]